jgi:hypothetical protein
MQHETATVENMSSYPLNFLKEKDKKSSEDSRRISSGMKPG